MRVLLVDTGFSAAPLHEAMVRAGHDVAVVGARGDDALARAGLPRLAVDYADAAALAAAAAAHGAERLVPGCNDVALASCATAATQLGLPGHDPPDAIARLLDKARFRRVCVDLGVRAPRLLADDEAVGRHVVVKPRRGFSGRGVTVLVEADRASLARAVAAARTACGRGEHLVEEFAAGRLWSHSAVLVDRRVVAQWWVREQGTADPLAVDLSCLDRPGDAVARAVRADVHRLADGLDLGDGLVHTQVLVDGSTHAVVEVTRRCPGDLYAELVRRSTDDDYAGAYVAGFLGTPAPPPSGAPVRPVLRVTLSPRAPTVLQAVELPRGLPPATLVPLGRAGDVLGAGPAGRHGVLFLDCADVAERDRLWDAAVHRRLHGPHPVTAAEGGSASRPAGPAPGNRPGLPRRP